LASFGLPKKVRMLGEEEADEESKEEEEVDEGGLGA